MQAEDITGSIWLPKYHTLRDSLKQFNMGKFPAWLERAHVDKVGEETGSSNKDKNVVSVSSPPECLSVRVLCSFYVGLRLDLRNFYRSASPLSGFPIS